jgi:alpha-1,2-mannosyltransferase
MYMTTFAFSYALAPSSAQNNRRTLAATLLFAAGAIVGWPFALALSIPFVLEELFVFSADRVAPEIRTTWMLNRWRRLFTAGLAAALIFVGIFVILFVLLMFHADSGCSHRQHRLRKARDCALEYCQVQHIRRG